MTKLSKQHDPLARKFLTDIDVAKEFLQIHLVPEILARCDLDTLVIEPTSYIEDDLKLHCSDVVYKIRLKNGSGYAYIYTLVEHQSSPDKLMPFRIIKYQIAIIQNHIDTYGASKPLPIVVPLVFYNGTRSPYPYSSNIGDLFDDKELYNTIGLGNFKLIDLTQMEVKEILKHGKVAVLEMLQKAVQVRDFKALIETIVDALKLGLEHGLKQSLADSGIYYLFGAREYEEIKPLVERIKQQVPDCGEDVMNFIDAIKLEGKQAGIQLGEQRGMQLGEQKGRQEVARNMLKLGINEKTIAEATNLTIEELRTLH